MRVIGTPVAYQFTVPALADAGSAVLVDLDAFPVGSGTERIMPWSRIDINCTAASYMGPTADSVPTNADGSTAMRIPAGLVYTIDGPGSFSKFYIRSVASATVANVMVWR